MAAEIGKQARRLLILGCTMRALDGAGKFLSNLEEQGNSRESVSLMKTATHLNKAVIETAPTLADGILDRLVHNAHRIEMRGDSMRKNRPKGNSQG